MSEMKRVSIWKRTEIRMVGKGRRGDSSGRTQRKDNIRMYVHTYSVITVLEIRGRTLQEEREGTVLQIRADKDNDAATWLPADSGQ